MTVFLDDRLTIRGLLWVEGMGGNGYRGSVEGDGFAIFLEVCISSEFPHLDLAIRTRIAALVNRWEDSGFNNPKNDSSAVCKFL